MNEATPDAGHTGTGVRPLLGPSEVRELARRLGVWPNKSLGQNFVVDANTVRRIARSAALTPDDVVLEVGPGLGSLTLALLDVAAAVVAIELDPVLAAALPTTIENWRPDAVSRLSVLHADALRLPPLPGPQPTALVANLPYNVSVPVLLTLMSTVPTLRHGLVMVQAEVAERLAAGPGDRAYGVPSVKAAWYARVRRAGAVGRSVFWPAPNVDSGLVAFSCRPEPNSTAGREAVFACVDAAFAQRRKTLRAALADWAGSPDAAEAALLAAGIDPRTRGEQLSVQQFATLADARPERDGSRPERDGSRPERDR